jgi:hypothetical protein
VTSVLSLLNSRKDFNTEVTKTTEGRGTHRGVNCNAGSATGPGVYTDHELLKAIS